MASEIISTYTLKGEDDTATLAQALAKKRQTFPLVMTLEGPLGVGKTTFMRFYLAALGWTGSVTSPTYGLIQVYDLSWGPLWHVDCYRLTHPDDIYELGLIEAMAQHPCCIEWPQRIAPFLPLPRHSLVFNFHGKDERSVTQEIIF
jgi:tRNA threonylcarbamoyladenosine biosynthesis protein TsaE